MALTAGDVATLVQGQLTGNPGELVAGVAGLRDARPGDISFVAHPKYFAALRATKASVILGGSDCPDLPERTVIRVANPSAAFSVVVQQLVPPPVKFSPGIHPSATISPSAQLGAGVSIQPHVVVEDGAVIGDRTVIGAGAYIGHESRVGADCLFYPHVTLRERTRVGDRVILHPGVVLGADGFGFENIRGERQKIPQVGTVELGDDVEMGANSCVDRGRFGTTRIGRGTKIDNLVQIGHNCVVGEHCVICAGTGTAGSVIVGNYVTLAGQVGIVGHITIGDRAIIGAQSGVAHDVPPDTLMLGAPAVPHLEFKRSVAALRKLPSLAGRLREIERQLAEFAERRSGSPG